MNTCVGQLHVRQLAKGGIRDTDCNNRPYFKHVQNGHFIRLHLQQVRILHFPRFLDRVRSRHHQQLHRGYHLKTRHDRVGARQRGNDVSRDFLDRQYRSRGNVKRVASQVCEEIRGFSVADILVAAATMAISPWLSLSNRRIGSIDDISRGESRGCSK